MKIKLPKTLAEPLTIPWMFMSPSSIASKLDIDDALNGLIDNYERRNLMPRTPFSPTVGVCTMLRVTAEGSGAYQASSTAFPIIECKTHIGYEYVVLMSLPNDKNLYHWSRKSWFPWSPS